MTIYLDIHETFLIWDLCCQLMAAILNFGSKSSNLGHQGGKKKHFWKKNSTSDTWQLSKKPASTNFKLDPRVAKNATFDL